MSMSSMSSPTIVRLLSLALLTAAALELATVVGFLVWMDTAQLSMALTRAGAAFAGTVTLGAAAWSVLRPR